MNLKQAMLEDYKAVQKTCSTRTDKQIAKQAELIGNGFVGCKQIKHILVFMLECLNVYIKYTTNEEYIKVATEKKETLLRYITKLERKELN